MPPNAPETILAAAQRLDGADVVGTDVRQAVAEGDLGAEFGAEGLIGRLPGHLGIVITSVGDGQVTAELPVQPHLLAPNGYLHAGSVVTLADTPNRSA